MELSMAIDTMWVLLAAYLVFLMHAGFTMLEIGFTRAKNAVNIIMKNMLTISVGAVTFFVVGFGLMFGESLGGVIGSSNFLLTGVEELDFGVPITAFWIFQAVFAATAATIVSGAVAERIKFISYFLFTIVLTAVIYPVVGHWVWGGGWLAELGFLDFAGSTVVHSTGGWAAVIVAYLLGARIGKYSATGKVNAIPGHNMPLGALGVMLLWFGWFGFNTGSTIAGTDAAIAPIAVVTILGAASGTLATMVFTWFKYGKPDPSLVLNGALAGLVGITAGADAVSPLGAIAMGVIAGVIMVIAVEAFDQKIKVDDPVGAISVHGICGAFGTLAVGLFAVEGGFFYGGGVSLLGIQLIGIVSVFAFVVIASLITALIVKAIVGLRVSEAEEEEGLDLGEHGFAAYGSLNNEKFSAKPVVGK
jgi:Amt family ammonium transporter